MAKKKSKTRKVPRGQPLPPADDSEFTPEALQAWGSAQALIDAEKHGGAEFNAMLAALPIPIAGDSDAG